MSRSKSQLNMSPKPRVRKHNSPPLSTHQVSMPSSPDMIPAFSILSNVTGVSIDSKVAEKKAVKRGSSLAFSRVRARTTVIDEKNKLEKKKGAVTEHPNKKSNPANRNPGLPLQLQKLKNSNIRKSFTMTNLVSTQPMESKLQKRPHTSRDDGRVDNDYFRKFLNSEFPPYNPAEFAPEEVSEKEGATNENSQKSRSGVNENEELLVKIRQELDEWIAESSREAEKRTCPEQWTAVLPECKEKTPQTSPRTSRRLKRVKEKENFPEKENVSVQTTPPPSMADMVNISFLNNPDVFSLKRPKTPSPLPKPKVLDVADELISIAEREFALVEAKVPNHFHTNKPSSRHVSESSSARRTMTDFQLSPKKGSIFSDAISQSKSKSTSRAPNNSPCFSSKCKDEEKYMINNSETKSVKPKLCQHHIQLNKSDQITKNKTNTSDKSPSISEFSMFYEQQKLVERKRQTVQEKNSATVIFKSDAKVISSTNVVSKQDVETNTDSEMNFKTLNTFKNTPNSSIISMKTNKAEQEDHPLMTSMKTFNVQKMPSVNIRPEFTVQSGPKINIVASTSNVNKPKRRNAEFFDVVYSSPIFDGKTGAKESNIETRASKNQVEYVCERHVFPSGRLIPGHLADENRETHLEDNIISLDEKKETLLQLIKSVSDKVEKQLGKENKICCQLTCSLPLLALMVNKIQLDCVKCVDVLNKQLDTLAKLMKEELRSQKGLSEDHCCQLDETVRYQIVELELLQDENSKPQNQSSGTLRVYKHKESVNDVKAPKKTVSFESIPGEVKLGENNKFSGKTVQPTKSNTITRAPSKSAVMKTKPSSQLSKVGDLKKTSPNRINVVKDLKQLELQKKGVNNVKTSLQKASSNVKGTTVVDQVMNNLTTKIDSGFKKPPPETSKTRTNLNAYHKIIDEREASSDIDNWVKDRSLKIQKIHEELNKMVAGTMENYIEAQSKKNKSSSKNYKKRTEALVKPHSEKDSEERVPFTINDKEKSEKENTDKESPESMKPPVLVLESSPDYMEDFEEDIDEASNNKSSASEDSQQQTLVEADGRSSVSSNAGDTNKEVVNLTVVEDGDMDERASDLSNKNTNDTKTKTLIGVGSESSLGKDFFQKTTEVGTPAKVSVATSPINLKSSEENRLLVEPSASSTMKKKMASTATSPIKIDELEVSKFKSIMVQTEMTEDDIPKNNPKESDLEKNMKSNDMQLLVPPFKLNPTPMENILQVSLGNIGDNSLAFETNSSNQTMKLVVQLPSLQNTLVGKQKIVELNENSETQDEKESQKISNKPKGSKNVNFSSTSATQPAEETYYKQAGYSRDPQNILHEKTIKDIIEPTVSEVLKKMSLLKNNPSTSSSTGLDEIDRKTADSSSTHPELTKPNIILQSKHGHWKNNPTQGFLEYSKQTMDSCNQTEAEKQSVHIQVAESLVGSVSEKAISVHKLNDDGKNFGRSYLEMLQPRPPPAESFKSSATHTSTFYSSSRSSSSTSTSSKRKEDRFSHMEKLSEGEIGAEPCKCAVGEVCEICIPKLDLSFGELKTKPRQVRRGHTTQSDSESDYSRNSKSEAMSLSSLPLHLEPKPPPLQILSSVCGQNNHVSETISALNQNVGDSTQNKNSHSPLQFHNLQNEAKQCTVNFAEIANSVISELNKEYLQSLKDSANRNPSKTITSFSASYRYPANTQTQSGYSSSSESIKSTKSTSSRRCKTSKLRVPLVIRPPTEPAKIDVVIEDSEGSSSSSYQTSVTSVSVDNLPEAHLLSDASS